MHILVHLYLNKANFHDHMKGFALGLALQQRRKANQKWAVEFSFVEANMILFKNGGC